jgi:hypothetical protein
MMPVGGELPPGIKEKKPADDPDLGAAGETLYRSSLKLPDGWTMTPPRNVNVIEDWAEYHSTYSFANGVFTAERRCLIKKATVPLAQWEQYLAFRRSMGSDEDTQVLISPPLPRGRHKN